MAYFLGFNLPNEQGNSGEMRRVGVSVSIQPGRSTARFPESRRHAIMRDLEASLAPGRLTPGQAAKLQGELGFSQSLMLGKFDRPQLQPCPNRQQSRALGGSRPLNAELRAVIPWRGHVLGRVDARRTMTHGPSPVMVYGDAAGRGDIGAVVVADGIATCLSAHVPDRMIVAQCGILDLELAASLGGLGKKARRQFLFLR